MADNRCLIVISGDQDDTLVAAWLENPCPEHGSDLATWEAISYEGCDPTNPMDWLVEVLTRAGLTLAEGGYKIEHKTLDGVISDVFGV